MRTRQWMTAAAAAIGLAAAGAALAVPISNKSGQSCGADSGAWHFVNNQYGGNPNISFSATWSSGDQCILSSPSKVTPGTLHFNCSASGTLLSASTSGPGRLVLSDFTCTKKTCDPKTEKCD